MTDWKKTYIDIQEKLFPQFGLNIWHQGLYFYLLRHTRLVGLETAILPLPQIAAALQCSEFQARKTIRTLADIGCIELEQTRKGHSVKVYLPSDLELHDIDDEEQEIDIEQLDFFKNREYVNQLLVREQRRCFYCLKEISEGSCELDHVIPQVDGGGNGYQNIVVACHSCNTRKQGGSAEEFIRQLYRRSLLGDQGLENRMQALTALSNGQLKPVL